MDSGATPVSRGTEPVHLLGQGVYYAYARDRDGIMYETEHLDRSPFEGPIWFSHVALVSPDLDRLVEFYGLLLNAEPNRRTNRASGPTFDEVADYDDVMIRAAWFDIGNMILEMWQFVNPVTPEVKQNPAFEALGYNKVAFEVSDLEKEVERLSDQGIEFLAPLGMSDDGLEVCLRDPDGNLISLIQPHDETGLSVGQLKQKAW
jgi:catechol 2,3-dioxygenase-like lactoylglutathione lyase family enzyme